MLILINMNICSYSCLEWNFRCGLLNRLGLQRPAAPRCVVHGRFDIAGVTVINPTRGTARRDRRSQSPTARLPRSRRLSPQSPGSAGCFALPGLIDMHVHLPPDNALKLTAGCGAALSSARRHHRSRSRRPRWNGGRRGAALGQRRRPSRARVFCCGPFVAAGKAMFKNTILLEDASEAAADAAARRVKAAGASFMKFYDGLTEPMIRALERACARHGLKIMGHVPGRPRLRRSAHRRGAAFLRRTRAVDARAQRAGQPLLRLARGRRAADGRDRRDEPEIRHRQHADHRHQPEDAVLPGLRGCAPRTGARACSALLSRRGLASGARPIEQSPVARLSRAAGGARDCQKATI